MSSHPAVRVSRKRKKRRKNTKEKKVKEAKAGRKTIDHLLKYTGFKAR